MSPQRKRKWKLNKLKRSSWTSGQLQTVWSRLSELQSPGFLTLSRAKKNLDSMTNRQNQTMEAFRLLLREMSILNDLRIKIRSQKWVVCRVSWQTKSFSKRTLKSQQRSMMMYLQDRSNYKVIFSSYRSLLNQIQIAVRCPPWAFTDLRLRLLKTLALTIWKNELDLLLKAF